MALASGRSEAWVTDRTGHKSSAMVAGYKRQVRTAAELDLEFPPVGGRVSSRFLSVRFDRAG